MTALNKSFFCKTEAKNKHFFFLINYFRWRSFNETNFTEFLATNYLRSISFAMISFQKNFILTEQHFNYMTKTWKFPTLTVEKNYWCENTVNNFTSTKRWKTQRKEKTTNIPQKKKQVVSEKKMKQKMEKWMKTFYTFSPKILFYCWLLWSKSFISTKFDSDEKALLPLNNVRSVAFLHIS